jgi:hypothetical protein
MHFSSLIHPWKQDFEGKSYFIGSNFIIEFGFATKSWFGFGSNHAFTARAYRADTPTTSTYTAKATLKRENYTVYDGSTGAVLEVVNLVEGFVQLAPINTMSLAE